MYVQCVVFALACCCITVVPASGEISQPTDNSSPYSTAVHSARIDGIQEWNGYLLPDNSRHLAPQLRTKRGIPKGISHIIDSFKKISDKTLNVATTIVTDISAKDCSVYCVKISCGAWSHEAATRLCRLGCLGKDCKYAAVPVTSPGSDFYQISLRNLGGALFHIIVLGAADHKINIQPEQIRKLAEPLSPDNVKTEPETHGVGTTTPTPKPPVVVTPAPGSGHGQVTPAPTPSPTPTPTPKPVEVVTNPPLSLVYEKFPEECGTRPTFGLSDNVRLLSPGDVTVKVVGGAEVATGTYPWQAQLEIAGDLGFQHSCGGIVIADNMILTAGHCHTKNERSYQVRVAQHNLRATDPQEKVFAVENIYRHSGYRPDHQQGQRNDIAVFKLSFQSGAKQRLSYNDYVQPLCLPTVNTTLFEGQECQISGWGILFSGSSEVSTVLRGAVIKILEPAICVQSYGNRFDRKLMVCAGLDAGGVDACQGDSGGPLSCRDETGQWFAAGIVSFGWDCGQKGSPGVYTRVTAYLDWVHRVSAFLNGQI